MRASEVIASPFCRPCFGQDLPANKLIEFKFLLQDSAGKLHWQNGPNRSFQTGETTNTVVVLEDWDDVNNQKIAEEEGVAFIVIEQTVVSNDSKSRKDTVFEDEILVDVDDDNQVKEDESVVTKEDKKPTVSTNESVQVDWVKKNEANPQKVTCLINTFTCHTAKRKG